MECRLPQEKLVDLMAEVQRVKHLRKVTLKELQSLLGKLNFACLIMPMGRVFCRRIAMATAGVGAFSGIGTAGGRDGFIVPRITVESAIRTAGELITSSLSGGTWSAYSRVWNIWEDWKVALGEVVGEESLLLLLVGNCQEEGWSVSRINRLMAGLAFGFKVRGVKDVTKSFLVVQALRGWRRGWKVFDRRRPVSYNLLLLLGRQTEVVCTSLWESRLFKLAFSLAFFAALRLGELFSASKTNKGGLFNEDVDLYMDRIELVIRSSKTDQAGKGCKVVIFGVQGSEMCPVKCLRVFRTTSASADAPLLVHADGSFLSRFQFVAIFKCCLEAGGVSPLDYSGHSFRIGAATEDARNGLSDDIVKRIGRWESSRFRSYIRPTRL
ncbi:uncharacterized protein [Phyllobates terribilis]|uniref:uncharacterized protein n=1 Tax=Phyllobates terribilis TaxID=111132 RepID=UPI003CCAB496